MIYISFQHPFIHHNMNMYKDSLNQIIIQIKHFREEAGFTQTEMAEKLEIGMRSYQRYESGEAIPSLNFIFAAATILKFDIKDLFSPLEMLNKIGEVTFYSGDRREEFINSSGPEVKELFTIRKSELFKEALQKNKLEAMKRNSLFYNSSQLLAISTPRITLLNPSARKALSFANDFINTSTFHSSPKNVGILWAALLQNMPEFFIMKTCINVSSEQICLESHNLFIKMNDHYFILRSFKKS